MSPVSDVHDQLQSPKSDVRDGEKVIIAHIFTPWLESVADKISLLISPHFFSSHDQDHNAENEEYSEPDFANAGGVFIDTPQNSLLYSGSQTLLHGTLQFKQYIIGIPIVKSSKIIFNS
uniref:Uncharacterized protein n=1 Tax=Sarcophilus harrisii TaxID=9305 RepID=A0A7N4NX98_SARHA